MGVAMMISARLGNTDFDDDTLETLKRYKPRSLDELASRTKFNKKEIQLIYQGFKQECPSGIVNEETFKHIYGQFFPFADTSSYAHLIFGTFDLRSSGCVTFEDFLICLSTLCRGSLEDRVRWIFTLYDTKKSGKLTRDDFHVIVCAVYSLLGNVSSPRYDLETIREHTATVFQRFDKLHQGFITIQDFMSFCLNDPTIVQSIDALRTTV
jgi:Ca2+-binding EF-hand superfamily protein